MFLDRSTGPTLWNTLDAKNEYGTVKPLNILEMS